MKIAIPVSEGVLNRHFGHCDSFDIFDIENGKIIRRINVKAPPHEPGLLPKWLNNQGVTKIIAGGMGQRAQAIFTANNIEVLVGAERDSSENLVKLFLTGSLKTGINLCDH